MLRIATWSGLLQFDSSEKAPPQAPLQLGFETVTAESPDGQELRRLPLASQRAPVEIPSGYRLHFRYGIVSMDSGLEFRYRLNGGGLPDDWSAWTDRDLYIRAITPGDYLLQVEARTRNGRVAAPTSYRYRIMPRWHENWWVRALGALALLGVIALLVQEFVRRRTQRYSRPTASSRRASASARTSWRKSTASSPSSPPRTRSPACPTGARWRTACSASGTAATTSAGRCRC